MKKLFPLLLAGILLYSCKNKEKTANIKDNRIYLHSDTLNVATMKDTMVIYESTCRGCAYEGSTAFVIKDSLNIVKLEGVETHDNNPEKMSGGNVSKTLVIVPLKTGSTTIKMYKFWKGVPSEMTDSIAPTATYKIEVRN
jgi:hypothetical protein